MSADGEREASREQQPQKEATAEAGTAGSGVDSHLQ